MNAIEGVIIDLNGLENLDTEVLAAYQYLAYKEKGLTNAQVADQMGIHESTLYRRLAEWKTNTVLKQAMQHKLAPKFEAIDEEIRATLEDYPAMLRRVRQIAMGKIETADNKWVDVSPHVSLEAFEILSQRVIDPAMNAYNDDDGGKKNYADAVMGGGGLVDPITAPMKGLLARVDKS